MAFKAASPNNNSSAQSTTTTTSNISDSYNSTVSHVTSEDNVGNTLVFAGGSGGVPSGLDLSAFGIANDPESLKKYALIAAAALGVILLLVLRK